MAQHTEELIVTKQIWWHEPAGLSGGDSGYVPSLDAQPGPQGEHGKAITLINTGLKINILGV